MEQNILFFLFELGHSVVKVEGGYYNMFKKFLSVMMTVILLLTFQIVAPNIASAADRTDEISAQSVNVTWGNVLSLPSKRNAYIAGKAYAPSTVTFVAASFKLWDMSGALIASASEDLSYTSSGLYIYYDIYRISGVLLNPSTKYKYKLTATFDGSTYESPEYEFTTEGENDNHFGIDVSSHQGRIDWETVSNYIDYAIIRCGFGSDYSTYDDQYWEYNASECERLGIPYGVYLYSYAENDSEADSEANHVLRLLGDHHPSLPVYYDLEDNNTVGKQTNAQIESQTNIFCNKLSAAGFDVGVYANLNWWNNRLTSNSYDRFHKWIAAYGNFNLLSWEIWQYSSSGSVPGISGNVDLNYSRESVQRIPVTDDPTVPEEDNSQLVIQSRTARAGEIITVSLELENASQLKSLALSELLYDDETLELLGGEWKLENSILQNWSSEKCTGEIAFANNTDVNGLVFELTFKIKDTAEGGDYFIYCNATAGKELENGSEASTKIPSVAGTLHVVGIIQGDVNGDNKVTSDDAIQVLYYTLLPEMYPVNQPVDFDGDGMITSDDAIYLLYYTLLPDIYPL